MEYLAGVAERHPVIAKYFTVSVVGLAGTGLVATHAMSVLGSFFSIFGSGLSTIASGIGYVILALWRLTDAMYANPWLLLVAGIAIAAYEIYEHWTAISKFFTDAADWMEKVGANLMHSLASGIAAGVMYPIHEAEALAHKIGAYFIGHSPPPVGPLHELSRTRIVETIAESMSRPRRATMAAAALAGAIAIGGGGGGIGGGITINLTVNVVQGLQGSTASDARKEWDGNARHLVDLIMRELDRRKRTDLS